jgi:hypothetical protein
MSTAHYPRGIPFGTGQVDIDDVSLTATQQWP